MLKPRKKKKTDRVFKRANGYMVYRANGKNEFVGQETQDACMRIYGETAWGGHAPRLAREMARFGYREGYEFIDLGAFKC